MVNSLPGSDKIMPKIFTLNTEEKILEIKSVLLKNNITYLINTPIIESLLLSEND